MLSGLHDLLRYTRATALVGDILKIRASNVCLGDMAMIEMPNGASSLAQVIQLRGQEVSLQVFGGGAGLSTQVRVRFLGHPTQVTSSENILGRVFRGNGEPMDGGPNLSGDRQVDIGGPSVNPVTRVLPTQMIRTNVPMIDVGMAIAAMSVERQFHRNTSTTAAARIDPTIRCSSTLLIDALMNSDMSRTTWMS